MAIIGFITGPGAPQGLSIDNANPQFMRAAINEAFPRGSKGAGSIQLVGDELGKAFHAFRSMTRGSGRVRLGKISAAAPDEITAVLRSSGPSPMVTVIKLASVAAVMALSLGLYLHSQPTA